MKNGIRQHKVILLHDNAPSHTAKLVKEMIEAFGWEILSLAAYSPDLLRPLLPLVCIDETRTCSAAFHFLRRCTKWLDLVAQKSNNFFGMASTNRWKKYIAIDGQYFE